MPVDYPYRKNTESLINDRISILKKSNTIEEAEKKIGMGQIEEVTTVNSKPSANYELF